MARREYNPDTDTLVPDMWVTVLLSGHDVGTTEVMITEVREDEITVLFDDRHYDVPLDAVDEITEDPS